MSSIRLAFIILAISVPSVAFAQNPANISGARTIEVTGHGVGKGKPDTMILSFGVDSDAKTADDCTRLQGEKTDKVISALKSKSGVDAKIDTSDFSFNPEYTYESASPAPTPAPPKPTWRFKAQVTAFAPSLENLGSVLQAGLAAGASGIGECGLQVHPSYRQSVAENQTSSTVEANSAISSAVTGQSYMKALPSVSVGIESEGSSPSEAMERGAVIEKRIEQAMLNKLNGKGAIDLTDFTLALVVPPAPVQQSQPQQQTQRIQRYVAHTTVTVETHNLDALGNLIDIGIAAGARQFNQVTFTLSEDSDARKRAIEKAAEDAKSKAATLAKSMGVKLGNVIRISTNAAVQPQVFYGASVMRSTGMHSNAPGIVAAPMTVAPRELEYSADVTVSYQID